MEAYIVDWLNLLVRWLHLVTGIAWIGASFYFVMLDNSLTPPKKPEDAKRGVFGELWAVHGGGFYNSQKYLTGPKGEPLSENLHWSKWEAYTTWLSGMGLLALIYWYGASSYLIDRNVMALTPLAGVAISIAFIAGGNPVIAAVWMITSRSSSDVTPAFSAARRCWGICDERPSATSVATAASSRSRSESPGRR